MHLQADEYFLFAGLIGIAAILFIFLSMRYEYVDESEFVDDDEGRLEEHSFNGKTDIKVVANGDADANSNAGFEHEEGF